MTLAPNLPLVPTPDVPPGAHLAVVDPAAVPAGSTVVGLLVLLPVDRTTTGPALSLVPDAAGPAASAGSPATGPTYPVDGARDVGAGVVLDVGGRTVHVGGVHRDVTRREFDLLAHLSRHPGRVLTREHLLEAVWGHDDPRWAAARTVDVHVARLRRKLGPAVAAALQTVRGVGYRWVP